MTANPARTAKDVTPGRKGKQLVKPGELVPVTFVQNEGSASGNVMEADLGPGYTEAPSALSPTADWQRIGEYLEGEYLGAQLNVGPNNSRLYNFRTPDGVVSVWGTQVLDNRMDLLNPPVGSIVKIIYVGDTEAKRGQNPARLFKLGYKPKGK